MSWWHHVFHHHHDAPLPPPPVVPVAPPPPPKPTPAPPPPPIIIQQPPVQPTVRGKDPTMGKANSKLTASAQRRNARASVLGLTSATAGYAPSNMKSTSSASIKSKGSGLQIRK
ncbi:TPA: hypothetical protein ACX6Q6_003549 [Photobacterium damselae]